MWFRPYIPIVISAPIYDRWPPLLMHGVDGRQPCWFWGWTRDWHKLVGPAGDSDTWAAWQEVCRFDELRSLIWGINQ